MELPLLAEKIRSLIKWGGYTLVGLAFIWIIWVVLSFSFKLLFPVEPDQADNAFGKISRPFQTVNANNSTTFDLQTPGGEFPSTPVFLPVFAVSSLEGKFTSLENGNEIAKSGGLNSDPVKLNEPVWFWTDSQNPPKSLRLNIVTNNFNYTYDSTSDPESLGGTFTTTEAEIVKKAQVYLNSFKSLKEDFKDGGAKISFWKIENNNRSHVGSFSEANAVLVEFFRKDVGFKDKNYPVVEPNTNLSSVNVLISPTKKPEKQLLELNFVYWGYDLKDFGTYDIETPQEAYAELKSGKSYVASNNGRKFKEVTISKIYLAYLNPIKETRLFQPVYVFEGEGLAGSVKEKFTSYIPAITNSLLK